MFARARVTAPGNYIIVRKLGLKESVRDGALSHISRASADVTRVLFSRLIPRLVPRRANKISYIIKAPVSLVESPCLHTSLPRALNRLLLSFCLSFYLNPPCFVFPHRNPPLRWNFRPGRLTPAYFEERNYCSRTDGDGRPRMNKCWWFSWKGWQNEKSVLLLSFRLVWFRWAWSSVILN